MSNHTFPVILISYIDATRGTPVEYVSVEKGRTVKGNIQTLDRAGYYTTVRPESAQPVLHGTEQLQGTVSIENGKLVVEVAS